MRSLISALFALTLMGVGLSPDSLSAMDHRDSTRTLASDSIKPVIYPDDPTLAALDALWVEERLFWQAFEGDSICLNIHGFKWDSIPKYSSQEIAEKLQRLNEQTPMHLIYNPLVEAYINVYVQRKRHVTSRVLGLAALYYPLFEEKLDQFDIPLELKHLAVVESALNPMAKSKAGATGLWQFMYTTGKMYGLHVDSYVDDRSDPMKSTIAACRYLRFLYGMYGDWNLVLAAYNAGPGNVNKAIRRAGGKKDYWEISPFLPRETRSYVPAFIAANYVMNYAADHNIYPTMPTYLFSQVDTVHVCRETSFGQLSAATGISVENLELLNPALKKQLIPRTEPCRVVYLPVDAVGPYMANAHRLDEVAPTAPAVVVTTAQVQAKPATHLETHVVRSGESLGGIAQRYKVSVNDIKEWNTLRSNTIQVGQKLRINQTGAPAATSTAQSTPPPVLTKPQQGHESGARIHVVQSGDTLWDIAKKYPGVSANDIMKANGGLNGQSLKPGQKIHIPPAS